MNVENWRQEKRVAGENVLLIQVIEETLKLGIASIN